MTSQSPRIYTYKITFTAVLFFVLGLNIGTVTARGETEEQTVVYCVEQPSACKTKYDYYKLENQK